MSSVLLHNSHHALKAPVQVPVKAPATHILLSEIISALTFALDLTEGALPGHSLRCCLLGMRIGTAAGLTFKELASLYYALQMKDAGCSSNASRMSSMVGGDERILKNISKITDWRRPGFPYLRELWRQCRPQASFLQRANHILQLAKGSEGQTEALISLRCERGADIAMQLQLGGPVADAVRNLDEHWDGSGFPNGKRGGNIPVLSRVCLMAQQLDAFAVAEGTDHALEALSTHRRRWFDPELIAVAKSLHQAGRLWTACLPTDDMEETRRAVLVLDPGLITELTDKRIDRVCETFASIVDAKSPFTYRHSIGVTQVACAIATRLELAPATRDLIRRAALLHDIGKLAVSNAILDKNGKLTEEEWAAVRTHPGHSGTILHRVPTFEKVALLAEQHHERLDGTGYPHRRTADELCLESRIIALADCYAAMAETRPYREGMPKERVLAELARDAPRKLDPACFDALQQSSHHWSTSFPDPDPEEEDDLTAPAASPTLNWNWPPLAEAVS